MNENLDLDELREKLRFAQSVPNVELVLKLIQELEETRAKHRKEWRRAERAEESRLHANVMINTVLEEMGSGPETDPIIKVRQLVARAEAAEQALDFHTQRDRELKTLLSMIADRLDEFCYDELASLIEDEPLNQWSESYTSKLQAAEAALSNQRSVVKTLAERNVELTKFKDAYSVQAQELEQAEAERDFRQKENKELFEQIERVREVAHYSNKAHREAILEALDGGDTCG